MVVQYTKGLSESLKLFTINWAHKSTLKVIIPSQNLLVTPSDKDTITQKSGVI